jgi:hypothetical protein
MPFNRAQFQSTSPIQWSTGTPFNGYVLLIMALPNAGAQVWTRVALRNCSPKRLVPQKVKIPIREGVYDNFTLAWTTDSLVPENLLYSAFFYDDTDQLIGIGSVLFSVTSSGSSPYSSVFYTLNPPTLTAPTASTISPSPTSVPSTQVVTVIYNTPSRGAITGTKNGVNTAFTLSSPTYVVAMILYNQTVLTQGVHYTLSGASLTMIAPMIPGATDTLEDILW